MKSLLLFSSCVLILASVAGIPKENLIAHKGGLEVAPANTLAAFERAFRDGFVAECDVRKSPNGTLYLSHDVRKDWWNATRLEDVLKIMTDRDVLELDIKEKGIEVASLLKKSKGTFMLPDGSIVGSSNRWLTVKWDEKKLTDEYFAEMSASNIAVNVWTIDDEKTAKRALARGAKWVTTNVPLAMSGLAAKGTHPDYAGDRAFVEYYRASALDIAERKMPKGKDGKGLRLSTGGSFSGFFVWDSVFGVLWALHAPERNLPIQETLDTFYALQDEDGFICREYTKEGKPCWDKRHPWAYNPPILAWGEVEMFRAGRSDTNRLARVYPHLVAFHQCYDRYLKRSDGLYFGDIIGGGMDDVPRWTYDWEVKAKGKGQGEIGGIAATQEMIGEAVREKFWSWMKGKAWKHGWNRQAGWIDMSAQMAFDCLNLAEIAEALGKPDEAAAWRKEHARIRALVNKHCWDEERGFYFDYTTEDGIIPRYTVAAFWTLLAKIPSAEQAARMAKTFDDPKLFGTPVPVTSMAPASKDYYAYGYWCGQSWPPTTYMTLRGLKVYGHDDLAARLARAWYNSNAMLFDRDHTVYEHVASREMGKRDSGMRDFCGWGALTPVAIADEFGYRRSGKVPLAEGTSKCDRWLKGYYGKLPYAEYSVIDRAARCLEGNTGCNREGLEKTWHWLPTRAARPSTAGIFFGVWNWDCAFMALAMCKWDVELARDQFRIFRELQRADGMYPDVWKGDNKKSDKRTSVQFSCTKPPVLAWAAWAAERAEHDETFLREAYESLKRNMAWWDEHRRNRGEGIGDRLGVLFHYDGESTNRYWRQTYAGWESGMDNSPRWDGKPWQLYPVDLNCYMVMSYRVMRDFAGALGLEAERDEWAARERCLTAAIESTLWDDETKCYCDWDFVEGKFSRVLTPMAFLPLYIGIAPKERAAAMARQAERLSPGWPSVSYDDKAFNPTGYWRGRTWINIAYFALKGLKWYGYDELAETGKATIMEWLMRNPSNFNENYNPRTGNPVGAMYFGWTNAFAIKFVLDWDNARSAEMPVGEETAAKDVLLTWPWQQNVYTNRFTIMCETSRIVKGLTLQYGEGYAKSVEMSCVEGKKSGTYVYKGVAEGVGVGTEVPYRLAIDGVPLKYETPEECTEGVVKLWKDEDGDFTCSVWGDNQSGAKAGDWDADKTLYVQRLFEHMRARKVDFGISSGDFAAQCNYDTRLRPLILDRTHAILSRYVPTYVAWGNHDYPGSPDSGSGVITPRYFESGVVGDPTAYGTCAADKDEDGSGAYYRYRNNVLFVFVHWKSVHDTTKSKYGKNDEAVKTWLGNLLATDRAKKAKFRILVQHAPLWMETWPGHNTTFLLEVAKKGGIDLVLSGHTHSYERVEKEGIVQITNGGMGALDHREKCDTSCGADIKVGGHVNTPYLWARQSEKGVLGGGNPVKKGCITSYGELSVKGDTLTYQAHGFNADGSYIGVFDTVEIRSRSKVEVDNGIVNSSETQKPRNLDWRQFMGKPVDNAAWKAYKDAIGETFEYPAGDEAKPVVNVSKTEIEKFLKWLNGTEGTYRLPTVSELVGAFGGDYRREVTEWTMSVDEATGWRRILGGNAKAAEGVWTSASDVPMIATDDCHANYLGFRLAEGAVPVEPTMDFTRYVRF